MRDIKAELQIRTAAPPIQDVDLYSNLLESEAVARFDDLVNHLRVSAPIEEERFQKYRVVASKGPFEGAGEVKVESGTTAAFRPAYDRYDEPYEYLRQLLLIEELPQASIYKLFVKVSYQILNRDGLKVSGGERSEFNLLQQIKDAQRYDLLLIDEPESSFDNLFLRSDVNHLIKDIARTMPVVVVTHNSTVGASIDPNFLLYTHKTVEDNEPVFRVYSGYPTDQTLSTVDGETISTRALTLNSLKAGEETYNQRKERYEALEG